MAAELALDALKERLAAIEHTRWAAWQRWIHDQCERRSDGTLVIPALLVERWERQIATPFEDLPERSKDMDRKEVDRYWPLIGPVLERGARIEKALYRAARETGSHDVLDLTLLYSDDYSLLRSITDPGTRRQGRRGVVPWLTTASTRSGSGWRQRLRDRGGTGRPASPPSTGCVARRPRWRSSAATST